MTHPIARILRYLNSPVPEEPDAALDASGPMTVGFQNPNMLQPAPAAELGCRRDLLMTNHVEDHDAHFPPLSASFFLILFPRSRGQVVRIVRSTYRDVLAGLIPSPPDLVVRIAWTRFVMEDVFLFFAVSYKNSLVSSSWALEEMKDP